MAVKAKELAEQLGLSPASVSLVLNNKPGVSDSTRERVLVAARALGYENAMMEGLQKQNRILFLVYRKNGSKIEKTSYFSQIFSSIIEGVESQAKDCGYQVNIAYMDSSNIQEVIETNMNGVKGILLLATEMNEEQMKYFANQSLPVVIIDNYVETADIDCLTINNEQGVELAISYLVSMGHKDIGYLHVAGNAHNFTERYFGFKRSIERHQLVISQENTVELSTSGGEAVYWGLKEQLGKQKKMPTAFFADNDIIAVYAIRVLREMNYRIPEDISIVGFDDIPLSGLLDPPLTTICTNKHAIGNQAVFNLINRIQHPTETRGVQKVEIKSSLVERKSVKRLEI